MDRYELPQGWAWTTIGEVADTTSGGTPSRKISSYYGGDIPWVKSGELRDNIIAEVEESITDEGLKNSSAKIFPAGTPVVALYGATVGKTGILGLDAATNQAVCAMFPRLNAFSAKFITYWLRSQRQTLIDMSSGGAQPNISQTIVKEFAIPLPPVAEQQRIVDEIETQFTRLDAVVAALKRAQTTLKRYRASVLKTACEGRLVPQNPTDEPASQLLERILAERRQQWNGRGPYTEPTPPDTSDLPELPVGWVWVTWDQVGFSQNGRAFPSQYYQPTGVKLLRPGNLHQSGQLIWNEENTRYMPEEWATTYPQFIIRDNELIINLTAQSLKDEFLGRVCLTDEGECCLLNQRLARLIPISIDTKYLLYLFKSQIFRRFVDGLNTGSLIQHMFTSQIAEFVFPLPPLAEQQRIVEEVERRLSVMDEVEATLKANLKRAERLRQSILKRAFEGKLVPQNPADESASVLLGRIREARAETKGGRQVGLPGV